MKRIVRWMEEHETIVDEECSEDEAYEIAMERSPEITRTSTTHLGADKK